jgi:hypothetical protein
VVVTPPPNALEGMQVRSERSKGSPSQVSAASDEAASAEGSVFVVRDEVRLAAAVTGADPTSGLVFYDLKTCLRLVGEDRPPDPKTAPPEAASHEGADDEAA